MVKDSAKKSAKAKAPETTNGPPNYGPYYNSPIGVIIAKIDQVNEKIRQFQRYGFLNSNARPSPPPPPVGHTYKRDGKATKTISYSNGLSCGSNKVLNQRVAVVACNVNYALSLSLSLSRSLKNGRAKADEL